MSLRECFPHRLRQSVSRPVWMASSQWLLPYPWSDLLSPLPSQLCSKEAAICRRKEGGGEGRRGGGRARSKLHCETSKEHELHTLLRQHQTHINLESRIINMPQIFGLTEALMQNYLWPWLHLYELVTIGFERLNENSGFIHKLNVLQQLSIPVSQG